MSGAGSRAKGAKFQRDVATWFNTNGYLCEKRGSGESGDDIHLLFYPMFSFELKDRKTRDFPGWMRQAFSNARGRIPVVIFKRYGVGDIAQQWVLLRGEDITRWRAQSPVPIVGPDHDEFVSYDRIAELWKQVDDIVLDMVPCFSVKRRDDYGRWVITTLGNFVTTMQGVNRDAEQDALS